ncbi:MULTISPECIES: XRE family transcriptional regulator [Burkholderia cepacia complex]|uniref:XRE family transcriptional regulator n=1 Tax=Burkholderia cepacia complex TaxID=87882 RepID=UPI001CF159CD|nr:MULTISPECIES: helix-turn-helix domain-containing protein [Burkholderia cepacia complex]MCA8264829.1 helix-turn-helix domain-containing protein [Burkholderia vietnamiensis]
MKTIGSRVRQLRIDAELSQESLARAVGVSQGLIAQIESGKNQGTKHIAALARVLNVSVDWLETGTGEPSRKPAIGQNAAAETGHPSLLQYPVNTENFRSVFVVGRAQGGLPERIWTDGDYPVGATDEYAEIATSDPHAFLAPVVGGSMAPRFNPGEFALVEPGTDPEIEDDVLVRLATGETMLKRLLSRRGGIRLGSYAEQATYTYQPEEITWMYYVAHPVPARKIKQRM